MNFDFKNNSTEYLDYINKRKNKRLLRTVLHSKFNPYFKEKVNRYFNQISKE